MNRNSVFGLAALGVAAGLLLANSLYIVGQTEQAIVLRLGKYSHTVNKLGGPNQAGVHLKAPFTDRVVKFSNQLMMIEPAKPEEITTSDQNRLMVDAYVRYQISDPLLYYQAMRGNEEEARDRLIRLINSSLREQLGSTRLDEIIKSRRGEIMVRTRQDVARRATASGFGVLIRDLRIKRADYPESNEAAVFGRMRSAREQQAASYRAQGKQEGVDIIARATKEADTIRGQADAERAKIFADSYGKDPSFAAFYRKLQAYDASLANSETTLILSPDNEFLNLLRSGPGR